MTKMNVDISFSDDWPESGDENQAPQNLPTDQTEGEQNGDITATAATTEKSDEQT